MTFLGARSLRLAWLYSLLRQRTRAYRLRLFYHPMRKNWLLDPTLFYAPRAQRKCDEYR
jgi:hypothetical protein